MNRVVSMDLNADVGEGCGFDRELVPLVSSVNIACGAHAGDEDIMRQAVRFAQACGAAIGAHPGFPDREHFGRRELPVGPEEAAALVLDQVRILVRVAEDAGAEVGHIKLHGALYNQVSREEGLARAVSSALAGEERRSGRRRLLVALAGSVLASAARAAGLSVVGEAFADRAYRPDGSLLPRTEPGAVISDDGSAARQALRIAREGVAATFCGGEVRVAAQTICIHGDRAGAPSLARRIRQEFAAAGIAVGAPFSASSAG